MKTLAAFVAGVAIVVGLGLFWSMGPAGRVVASLLVAAVVLYGILRLALYRPDYAHGAGLLDEMRGVGKLTPMDDAACAPSAEKQDGNTNDRP